MDKKKEKNNQKSKKESDILKEKPEDNSLSVTRDITAQNIIQDIQKNDMTLSLNKIEIKKKNHYDNKGNVYMFLFDENSVPRIVIGPHCKKEKIKINNYLF